jgi:hypothetical protein
LIIDRERKRPLLPELSELLLGCHADGQPGEVGLIARCAVKARMWPSRIIEVAIERCARLTDTVVSFQIHPLYLTLRHSRPRRRCPAKKVSACDARIEAVLKELSIGRGRRSDSLLSLRRPRTDQANGLAFDVGAALFALLGKDLTQIDGLGPYLSLKLIADCGDDLSTWASAKHFTSCLGLAPSNKISGGKVLSSRTRRCGNRAAALLRLATVTVGRTDTALGAFNLHRRAKVFGFVLQPTEPTPGAAVS